MTNPENKKNKAISSRHFSQAPFSKFPFTNPENLKIGVKFNATIQKDDLDN